MIETDRLLLRTWRDSDVDPMYAISSDPVVMEHFPRASTWEETADMVVRHRGNLAWGRPGLFAVETLDEPAVLIGFDVLGLEEVVSFTATINERSRAVMRRLGMTHDPADDFDHPMVAPDSPLRRHVLYRLVSG